MIQKTKKVYLYIYAAIKNHAIREYLVKWEKTHNIVSEKGRVHFLQRIIPIPSNVHR